MGKIALKLILCFKKSDEGDQIQDEVGHVARNWEMRNAC